VHKAQEQDRGEYDGNFKIQRQKYHSLKTLFRNFMSLYNEAQHSTI
jgi:hypothetical protein